jgi:pimeloyl-ACP methyl ester carboxylesterase
MRYASNACLNRTVLLRTAYVIYLYKYVVVICDMTEAFKQTESVVLACLGVLLITSFAPIKFTGFAILENDTSIISDSLDSMSGNNKRIVLVHGSWSDGSVWSKVIPILTDAGYWVIAAQLPLHSLENDVATVERAVERIGGPTILVGHSYGGEVITNAGYNNPNVTGLVYIAALAPDEGETGNTFFEKISAEFSKTYFESIANDSAGFLYFNPIDSMNRLLKTSIRLMLIFWPLYRNHSINLLLQKHLVLQHGNSSRLGIRYPRMIVWYLQKYNEFLQNEWMRLLSRLTLVICRL